MSVPQRDTREDEGSSFDMWRDYMALSRVLQRLRAGGEPERAPRRGSEEAAAGSSSVSISSSSGASDGGSAPGGDHCHFCRQNGESPRVYLSHRLKTEDGSKVTCPVLRRYTCPACDATGDRAHTRRYCPQPFGKAAGRLMPVFW